jgi:hypothetical protein
MLKRLMYVVGVGLLLCAVYVIVLFIYLISTRRGPINPYGDQPPTACTQPTVEQDCRKLNCISRVWFCDQRGRPVWADGGDVVPKPTGNNPNHCEMCGVTAQKASKLMTVVPNPAKKQ